MEQAVVVISAVLLDRWLGEPRRAHPLALFGRWAEMVEDRTYHSHRIWGVVALIVTVLPFVVLAAWLGTLEVIGALVSIALLYLALGATSLAQHGSGVAEALRQGELPEARKRVQWMVSRETDQLDQEGVARAAVESVLENGNDAAFGAIFWYLALGAPGIILYRLVNTLDAMWGYRNERYQAFGWAAARLDDLLNWVPARLTAITYSLLGHWRRALRCLMTQGPQSESPNAGRVMAAGAGALGLQLGGPATYGGKLIERPQFGEGHEPQVRDIERAIRLVQYGLILWSVLILAGALLFA